MKKTTLKNFTIEELQVLGVCQLIFKRAEELYISLAENHHENREVARMWSMLAIDKCNHSDTYKMAARLKGDGIKEINITPEVAAQIFSKMKAIPVINQTNIPSADVALKFTIKMEESLCNAHFSRVVSFQSEQDTALMFSSLRSSGSILHMMTEEYLNLTLPQSDSFEDFCSI